MAEDRSNDQKVIEFFQSQFSSKENSLTAAELDQMGLKNLLAMNFQPKDLWGNRDYIFGYGSLRDGSLVMVAWKNNSEASKLNLKELSGIYTDERLASVQDDKGLGRWRKMREEVAGAFISVRKNESRVSFIYPYLSPESLSETGRITLNKMTLDKQPLVVRFHVGTSQRIKSLVGALPDR